MKTTPKNIASAPAHTSARKQLVVILAGILIAIIGSLVLSQTATASHQSDDNKLTSYDLQTPVHVVSNLKTTFAVISHGTNLILE